MKDGSRVVVLRPNFSESWAFFVRKFAPPTLISPEQLLIHENKENVIELLKYLIRGARVTAITGEQGCGKTTLLMAIMNLSIPQYLIFKRNRYNNWTRRSRCSKENRWWC